MESQKQARILLHQRRLAAGLSMTALAQKVKRSRESVSRAVNHGLNRNVLAKVKEVLGV
jgi:predicted transcriptional regulator